MVASLLRSSPERQPGTVIREIANLPGGLNLYSATFTPPRPPMLEFPCRLPPDERGIPHGEDYSRVFRSGYDNARGTASSVVSAKSGRVLNALAGLERSAIYDALLDPDVLDIRDQYPAWDELRLKDYLEDPNRRIPRSKLPTMDLVLTKLDGAGTGICFEVVNCKWVKDLSQASVRRRIDRDAEFCQKLNWKFTLFTERERSEAATEAARLLCNVAAAPRHDLNRARDSALAASPKVRAMADGRSYRELKKSVGRSLRIDSDEAGFLIAVMALYGFISVDLSCKFDESSPFCLQTNE
jgi:hypothetical protein